MIIKQFGRYCPYLLKNYENFRGFYDTRGCLHITHLPHSQLPTFKINPDSQTAQRKDENMRTSFLDAGESLAHLQLRSTELLKHNINYGI